MPLHARLDLQCASCGTDADALTLQAINGIGARLYKQGWRHVADARDLFYLRCPVCVERFGCEQVRGGLSDEEYAMMKGWGLV